ncbi:MAG: DUF3656 domain-containing U32 family peptidase [Christensenellales bacterium]
MPELLSPVGGPEQLLAAVRCGADAVYLGAKGFNARRNAHNFGALDLPQAVSYCHEHGVKVHVTVNTLVTDPEWPQLLDTLQHIAQSGVDAVIVQDLGVAQTIREACPTLPLHASTQMAIHNLAGAQALWQQGFARAVLARELCLEEIRAIADNCPIELEVFVHGALCMSVSGLCTLSSMLGGRSGNRGLCAQPCRLDFRCRGRSHALSLKDLCAVRHVRALAEAGVASFKIEGRMKRPEYVAAATTAYRQALDGQKPNLQQLQAVFSRSGFTDGYLTGRRDLSMFGIRRKEDVQSAKPVLSDLARLYHKETPRVGVDMSLELSAGRPARLCVSDGEGHCQAVQGPVPETARTKPTDEHSARASFQKTGGTPYFLHSLACRIESGLMLPSSGLNALRKQALEGLSAQRSALHPHAFDRQACRPAPGAPVCDAPALRLRFARAAQMPEEGLSEAEKIILPIEEIEAHPELLHLGSQTLVGELPLLVFPTEEQALSARLSALYASGLRQVIGGNLGTLALAQKAAPFTLLGDAQLNILNQRAAAFYHRFGIYDLTLSYELNARLAPQVPGGVLAYGFLPLMAFRACPGRAQNGCGDCPGHFHLTDRKGIRFQAACHHRRYTQLFNSVPLYIGDRRIKGVAFETLYFTFETQERCRAVLSAFQRGVPLDTPVTKGLYYRTLQ